jgi:hypothetical protein
MKPTIRKWFWEWFDRSKWGVSPLSAQARALEAAFKAGFNRNRRFQNQKEPSKRPPVGVAPRWVWYELNLRYIPQRKRVERIQDLQLAIKRYQTCKLEPDPLWVEELEILKRSLV